MLLVLHVFNLVVIAGCNYKFPFLGISSVQAKSLTLRQKLLFTSGCKSIRKGIINVSTTGTSLFRTSELLDAYEDEYDGVIVDPDSLPSSANAFAAILQASISYWTLKVVYINTSYINLPIIALKMLTTAICLLHGKHREKEGSG